MKTINLFGEEVDYPGEPKPQSNSAEPDPVKTEKVRTKNVLKKPVDKSMGSPGSRIVDRNFK